MNIKLLDCQPDDLVTLPARGNETAQIHVFEAQSIAAINAAIAARRPLLVRGEPGIGKSQLARAAAVKLERTYVQYVVDSSTESSDLKYQYDAVQRLAEAQIQAALNHVPLDGQQIDHHAIREQLAVKNFVSPGPLWWAFNWEHAKQPELESQLDSTLQFKPPPQFPKHNPDNGCVVLIDEIDKAEPEVPNGLLEALGDGQFNVPGRDEPVEAKGAAPLVIITTNEERSLPQAFIRRCLVLPLKMPDQDQMLGFLVQRGKAHFKQLDAGDLLQTVAQRLIENRNRAQASQLRPLPGQAEYLDLLRAIDGCVQSTRQTPRQILDSIEPYILKKHDGLPT